MTQPVSIFAYGPIEIGSVSGNSSLSLFSGMGNVEIGTLSKLVVLQANRTDSLSLPKGVAIQPLQNNPLTSKLLGILSLKPEQ